MNSMHDTKLNVTKLNVILAGFHWSDADHFYCLRNKKKRCCRWLKFGYHQLAWYCHTCSWYCCYVHWRNGFDKDFEYARRFGLDLENLKSFSKPVIVDLAAGDAAKLLLLFKVYQAFIAMSLLMIIPVSFFYLKTTRFDSYFSVCNQCSISNGNLGVSM